MNNHREAVWNALAYMDSKYGAGYGWSSQVRDWQQEFNIKLHRYSWLKNGDEMEFESKEHASAWLLRFS